jgi:cytochrome c biogenesis factor
VSPLVRGLVGIPVYAFIFVAAEAGRLFEHSTPVVLQIGAFAAINVGYGLVLGSWWALLVPGFASLVGVWYLDEPSPVENSDGSAGVLLLGLFVLPSAVMIMAGVAARKLSRRPSAG